MQHNRKLENEIDQVGQKKKERKRGKGEIWQYQINQLRDQKQARIYCLGMQAKMGKLFFFLTKEIIIKGYDSDYL